MCKLDREILLQKMPHLKFFRIIQPDEISRNGGHVSVFMCTAFTCCGCGLWDLLLIDIQVQRSLTQLLQVPGGGPAEALQRQAHVLLSDEQSFHHTLGRIQQICEGNLGGRTIE